MWQLGKRLQEVLEKGKKMKWSGRNRHSICIGYMAIPPRHNKLITALRTAVENGEGTLNKEATSHGDLLDSYRLSLMFWH